MIKKSVENKLLNWELSTARPGTFRQAVSCLGCTGRFKLSQIWDSHSSAKLISSQLSWR